MCQQRLLQKYIPDVLTEIIEKYRPEGFADNSWKGLEGIPSAIAAIVGNKFKEECGLELPERVFMGRSCLPGMDPLELQMQN